MEEAIVSGVLARENIVRFPWRRDLHRDGVVRLGAGFQTRYEACTCAGGEEDRLKDESRLFGNAVDCIGWCIQRDYVKSLRLQRVVTVEKWGERGTLWETEHKAFKFGGRSGVHEISILCLGQSETPHY